MHRFFSWRYLVPSLLGLAFGWGGHHGWVLTRAACVSARAAATAAVDLDTERALAHADPFAERIAEARILPERESRLRELSREATGAQAEAGFYLRFPYPKCGAPEFAEETALHAQAQAQIRSLTGSAEALAIERGWQADTVIYCRSLLALDRLERVRDTATEACKKRPSKYTQSCRTKMTTARGLDDEIEQLMAVRGINERKLLDKWGARLAALVHCDLGPGRGAAQ